LIRVTKKDRSVALDQLMEEFNKNLTVTSSKRTIQLYSRVAKRTIS